MQTPLPIEYFDTIPMPVDKWRGPVGLEKIVAKRLLKEKIKTKKFRKSKKLELLDILLQSGRVEMRD